MGELRVLDKELGDMKVIWDPKKPHEVEAAKETFMRLKEKNYLAYDVGKLGKKGNEVEEFDPSLEKLIMTPPLDRG